MVGKIEYPNNYMPKYRSFSYQATTHTLFYCRSPLAAWWGAGDNKITNLTSTQRVTTHQGFVLLFGAVFGYVEVV